MIYIILLVADSSSRHHLRSFQVPKGQDGLKPIFIVPIYTPTAGFVEEHGADVRLLGGVFATLDMAI